MEIKDEVTKPNQKQFQKKYSLKNFSNSKYRLN